MDKMRYRDAGALRAVLDKGKRILEVLAVPYGSPSRRDRKREYFSARTELMFDVGDRRPTLYLHGFSPQARKMDNPPVLGVAEFVRRDKDGVWMSTELDDSELSNRTWDAALKGDARASTGSVNYLERVDKLTGEVLVWPVAELSVFDGGDKRIPASDDAVVLPLRALFKAADLAFPEAFEAGEDEDATDEDLESIIIEGDLQMEELTTENVIEVVNVALDAREKRKEDERKKEAEMRKSIIDELRADPAKYRATFNVIDGESSEAMRGLFLTSEDEEKGFTLEDKKETWQFVYQMRKGGAGAMRMDQRMSEEAFQAFQAGDAAAMRVLEESEALEGGPLIPTEMLNQISAMRDEISLVTACNLFRVKSNSLVFNFPVETTGMGALAAIAEEGAYVANEPAFATIAATQVKYGSMITVTEELLEDQNIFMAWFVKACGRKWALAENLELFTFLKAGGTDGTHSATFAHDEILAHMFTMSEPWIEGCHLIMASATMANIRGLLIATPRAFGDFPIFGGREYRSFMGTPAHLNSNWEAIGAGDTTLTMTLLHPDAIGWVERKGMTIKVDPYGDAANGRIRYFPHVRFDGVILHAVGVQHYTDHA